MEMNGGKAVDTENTISKSGDKMGDAATTACNIVKIIRPLQYATNSLSSNTQDVSLTFLVKRSDGTEIIVDNKYLKAYHPLLLINFYEEHLRPNPTS